MKQNCQLVELLVSTFFPAEPKEMFSAINLAFRNVISLPGKC